MNKTNQKENNEPDKDREQRLLKVTGVRVVAAQGKGALHGDQSKHPAEVTSEEKMNDYRKAGGETIYAEDRAATYAA